jgi:hypothetical protein
MLVVPKHMRIMPLRFLYGQPRRSDRPLIALVAPGLSAVARAT